MVVHNLKRVVYPITIRIGLGIPEILERLFCFDNVLHQFPLFLIELVEWRLQLITRLLCPLLDYPQLLRPEWLRYATINQ